MINYAEWCNLCQSAPAQGQLSGYFSGLPDEPVSLMVCSACAGKAMNEVDTEGLRP